MTRFCQNYKPERKSKNKLKKFTKPIFFVTIIAVFVCAIGVYLFEVNYIAAKGFYIRDLEQSIVTEKEGFEKLQLEMIGLRSMVDLSEKVEGLGMQPVDKITYYDSAGQVVARR